MQQFLHMIGQILIKTSSYCIWNNAEQLRKIFVMYFLKKQQSNTAIDILLVRLIHQVKCDFFFL